VREAELKAGDANAPEIDEDHYAIVVYGVPGRTEVDAGELKKKASLQRDGKKNFKPSDVQVLRREDGPVIVYLFPRKTEITKADRRVLLTRRSAVCRFPSLSTSRIWCSTGNSNCDAGALAAFVVFFEAPSLANGIALTRAPGIHRVALGRSPNDVMRQGVRVHVHSSIDPSAAPRCVV
jgi:hypothetical protein